METNEKEPCAVSILFLIRNTLWKSINLSLGLIFQDISDLCNLEWFALRLNTNLFINKILFMFDDRIHSKLLRQIIDSQEITVGINISY